VNRIELRLVLGEGWEWLRLLLSRETVERKATTSLTGRDAGHRVPLITTEVASLKVSKGVSGTIPELEL